MTAEDRYFLNQTTNFFSCWQCVSSITSIPTCLLRKKENHLVMDNKYTLSIILIICNHLLISSNGNPLMGEKVEPAEENEFPFIVSLGHRATVNRRERYLNHFCGGSLITQRHVLTAAHCLHNEDPRNVTVTVGNVDLNEGNIYTIKSWITYDEWKMNNNQVPGSSSNDIAVVTLWDNITDIEPAVRSNLSDIEICGREAVVAGWGLINNDLKTQFLQKANVRVLTSLECKSNVFMLFGSLKPIRPNHYYTAAQPPVVLGCGDSGGPLILKATKEIIAVNSAACNVENAVRNRYATSIHIKVNYFKEFIDDVSKING